MSSITFKNVGKRYSDGCVAIESLDLEVQDGEFLVLVGPSGCGKSTALRMIAGLEDITSGELRIGDTRANGLAPRDRDIAMVFQSYALYPHLSVEDNIGFGLAARGISKAEIAKKVKEVAELLELTEYLHRKPARLSGGQRQRVAMGRALVRNPKAFLMDEPLSNLDARLRGHMRSEIARLQRMSGVTTIYVTHDQVEAMTMGDRVAVMKDGDLQQIGTPSELYDAPANLFVAGFIGAPTMNFLRGRLETTSEGSILVIGPTQLPIPQSTLATRPTLSGFDGKDVIVGVRPEMLQLSVVAGDGANGLTGKVVFVEDFGATQLIHVEPEDLGEIASGGEDDEDELAMDRTFRVTVDRTVSIAAGDNVALSADPDRLYFFDPETQLSIASA